MSALPKEHTDAFLTELDELQRGLSRMRDTYIRLQFEIQSAVQSITHPKGEMLTAVEVARILEMKEVTVRNGAGGTDCLHRGRVQNGRSVRYPRALAEIHLRNRNAKGKCGSCDVEYRKRGDHLTRVK